MKSKYRFCNDKRRYYREEYLKSGHWRELKSSKLKQVCFCEKCGVSKRLDVHHLNYRSLYDVRLTDLMVLCRKCHIQEHTKTAPKKKKSKIGYEYRRRVQMRTVLPRLNLSVLLWILSQLLNDPVLRSKGNAETKRHRDATNFLVRKS